MKKSAQTKKKEKYFNGTKERGKGGGGGSQEFDEIVANEEKPEWNRGDWEVGGRG